LRDIQAQLSVLEGTEAVNRTVRRGVRPTSPRPLNGSAASVSCSCPTVVVYGA